MSGKFSRILKFCQLKMPYNRDVELNFEIFTKFIDKEPISVVDEHVLYLLAPS